jgi:maleate cis-trans isomerase
MAKSKSEVTMHEATPPPHLDAGLVLDRQNLPYQLDEGIGYRARIGLIVLATDQTIRQAVLELGRSDAVDTVFVACTSLRVADSLEGLEKALGKPVTSSNHALAWHCLRLAGYHDPVPGFGRLFIRPQSGP